MRRVLLILAGLLIARTCWGVAQPYLAWENVGTVTPAISDRSTASSMSGNETSGFAEVAAYVPRTTDEALICPTGTALIDSETTINPLCVDSVRGKIIGTDGTNIKIGSFDGSVIAWTNSTTIATDPVLGTANVDGVNNHDSETGGIVRGICSAVVVGDTMLLFAGISSPQTTGTRAAGEPGRVYRGTYTTDWGGWELVHRSGLGYCADSMAYAVSGNCIAYGTYNAPAYALKSRIYTSTDLGTNWTTTTVQDCSAGYFRHVHAVVFGQDTNELFLATEYGLDIDTATAGDVYKAAYAAGAWTLLDLTALPANGTNYFTRVFDHLHYTNDTLYLGDHGGITTEPVTGTMGAIVMLTRSATVPWPVQTKLITPRYEPTMQARAPFDVVATNEMNGVLQTSTGLFLGNSTTFTTAGGEIMRGDLGCFGSPDGSHWSPVFRYNCDDNEFTSATRNVGFEVGVGELNLGVLGDWYVYLCKQHIYDGSDTYTGANQMTALVPIPKMRTEKAFVIQKAGANIASANANGATFKGAELTDCGWTTATAGSAVLLDAAASGIVRSQTTGTETVDMAMRLQSPTNTATISAILTYAISPSVTVATDDRVSIIYWAKALSGPQMLRGTNSEIGDRYNFTTADRGYFLSPMNWTRVFKNGVGAADYTGTVVSAIYSRVPHADVNIDSRDNATGVAFDGLLVINDPKRWYTFSPQPFHSGAAASATWGNECAIVPLQGTGTTFTLTFDWWTKSGAEEIGENLPVCTIHCLDGGYLELIWSYATGTMTLNHSGANPVTTTTAYRFLHHDDIKIAISVTSGVSAILYTWDPKNEFKSKALGQTGVTPPQCVALGRNNDRTAYGIGRMGNVRFWNTASLSSADIKASFGLSRTNPTARWGGPDGGTRGIKWGD